MSWFHFQFDPNFQRFHSMRVSYTEHFKPNWQSFKAGAYFVLLPIIGFAELVRYTKNKEENSYRTGQISYKDRRNKFF